MGTTGGVGLVLPKSLSDMDVDSGLLQKKWNDNKLYMESLQPDPLFNSMDLTYVVEVGPGKNVVDFYDNLFIDVTPKDGKGKGARSVTLAFMKSFNMDPTQGNASDVLGSEDTIDLKYHTTYANDWAGAVTEETFGIDAREMMPYGVYAQIRGNLGRWLGEVRGYYARTALVTTYSTNLTAAPVSMTAALNPVQYVAKRGNANQPAYDSTLADFENAIGAQLTTAGATALLDVPELLAMTDYAWATKDIEPCTIAGQQMYVLVASVDAYRRLNDPSVSNSWRATMQAVIQGSDVAKAVPGAKMIIDDKLVVVRDPRAPELVLSGVATNYVLTYTYMKYGRTDDRTGNAGTTYFDVNFLLGRGCLCKYEPELPHYENQPDVYGKYKGTGLFGAVGYTTPIWDIDTKTDSTAQQESSMVVYTSRV